MLTINPYNVDVNDIQYLTPRRKEYIRQRNVALEQQIDDISVSIKGYENAVKAVKKRYCAAKLEEQCLLKPYLSILYYELGQLFEEKGEYQTALRYFEQAGRYGHSDSIENAKRLRSKTTFDSVEKTQSSNNKYTIPKALYKNIVLIKSDDQKGSGILAKDDTLGKVIVTVDHVVISHAIAYVRGNAIALDNLDIEERGPNTFIKLANPIEVKDESIPSILMNAKLKIGEKVYFGGYPFKKLDVHLHIGHISSIGKNGKFSIDGGAVPGMSGGPVAIERDGKFYIVGTIASETFDPVDGFSGALGEMHVAESDKQIRHKWAKKQKQCIAEDCQSNARFTKIPKNNFFIDSLRDLRDYNPEIFNQIWEDLNNSGIILDDDGTIVEPIPEELGLRQEFQKYEKEVRDRLEGCSRMKLIDSSEIGLPFNYELPTDSLNTVGLSLVQSLSTGIITGNLFQEFPKKNTKLISSSSDSEESSQFEIVNDNLAAKIKKEAQKARKEAIKNGTFVNNNAPPTLYRYVSNEAAKDIKKNGIIHIGGPKNEIPFLTKANKSMARSVGAVTTDKLVTIFTDLIPNLSGKNNVRKVSEQNGVVTYRLNITIPPEAIIVSSSRGL